MFHDPVMVNSGFCREAPMTARIIMLSGIFGLVTSSISLSFRHMLPVIFWKETSGSIVRLIGNGGEQIMEFKRYLRMMGKLYFEGAISDFHPNLLKRFGGSLAMCAGDVQHIRIDPDSWFGLERGTQDRWAAAGRSWHLHAAQIQVLLNAGNSPTDAVFNYCARFRTTPHTPAQLEQALMKVMMTNGSVVSSWQVSTLEFRQRLERGSKVMKDTFGAIGALGALVVTAKDWQNATPQEWDRALNVGEVTAAIGQMAGAHADARQMWQDRSSLARSAH